MQQIDHDIMSIKLFNYEMTEDQIHIKLIIINKYHHTL